MSARHVLARASRIVQARPHAPVQDGTSRAEVSTFTPKCSSAQPAGFRGSAPRLATSPSAVPDWAG